MSIAPLLSKLIPAPLAIKGLSKLNSKVGKFIFDATAYGYGADQILDYLRNQFEGTHQTQERSRLESGPPSLRPDELSSLEQMKQREAPSRLLQKGIATAAGLSGGLGGMEENEIENQQPKEVSRSAPQVTPIQEEQMDAPKGTQIPQGILEALSPKLKQFVEDRISKGNPLARIADLAKAHFFEEINSLQEESGMAFADLLESLYGKQRETSRVLGLKNQPSEEINQAKNAFLQGLQQLNKSLGG